MAENNQNQMLNAIPHDYEGDLQLYDYFQIISRRKALIAVVTAACVVLAIVYNLLAPRIYQATTSIVIPTGVQSNLISSLNRGGINLPGDLLGGNAENEFNTEVQKIRSPVIAKRALDILIAKGYFRGQIKSLGAQNNSSGTAVAAQKPVNGPSQPVPNSGNNPNVSQQTGLNSPVGVATAESHTLFSFVPNLSTNAKNVASTDESKLSDPEFVAQSAMVSMILNSIAVSIVKNSNTVQIYAASTNPELARDMANAMADSFVNYSSEYIYTENIISLRYLTDTIEEVRQKLLKSRLSLNEYRAQKNILEPQLDQQLYVSKRTQLDMTLVELRNQRLDAEAQIKELRGILARPMEDVVLPSAQVSNDSSGRTAIFYELRGKLIEAQLAKNELESTVTRNSEEYKAVESRIIMLNGRLRDEIKKIVKSLGFQINVISSNEQEVQSITQSYDDSANQKQKQTIQYMVLQQDAETYQWLYQYLLGSVLVAEINSKKSQDSSVEIFNYATKPIYPIRPRKLLNILIGLMLGLTGGVGLAFGLESMNQAIVKSEEVEEQTGIPLLAILPHLQPDLTSKKQTLMVDEKPQDHFSEGVSRLWLNLRNLFEFKGVDAIIISSTLAAEGKSIISSNLASVASNNLKTILLDCDLRRPSLKNYFEPTEKSRAGLNKAIELLYKHPSEFASENGLRFADIHALIKTQKLAGTVAISGGSDEPLQFHYNNGVVHSSNYNLWKKDHHKTSLEAYLEKNDAVYHETSYVDFPVEGKNGESLTPEFITMLNRIPTHRLIDEITNRLAIKGKSKGLWVLESKSISYNPSELISSIGMKELIRILRRSFDLLIIDTPPSMSFADINAFSGILENILLVVRSGNVTRKAIVRVVSWFKQMNFNIIGYVFNDTQLDRDNYYYYGYYSYKQYKKSGYGNYRDNDAQRPE